jgi:formylglycine-generating enzyme required for sulfatase activity
VLWVAESIVLLAVLEAFVLRPWLARRQPAAAPATVAPGRAGVPAAALGERARVLPGLREVVPAFLADLGGLAPGSATMRSAQESFAADACLPVEVENTLGMRFRLVPPGTAVLGSAPEEAGRGEGEVQHVFAVPSPFYLGAFEVSQSEWLRCIAENPSHYQGSRRPVEEVTWYDCQRFLAALCRLEQVPDGTYRLPTEQEWEYACRAGTSTAYCSGDSPAGVDAFATHGDNGGEGTVAVGLRRPNALGLFDMHGNVWEWCQNRFGPYPGDDRAADPEHDGWRCLRGGNWYVPRSDCRSAERGRLPPASKGNMLGFRVLRVVAPPERSLDDPPGPPLAPRPAPPEQNPP